MKLLLDAHIPRRLTYGLREAGRDVLHTLDLPRKNRTTDAEILEISERDQRIVVTKDADFVNSFLLHQRPYKLLLISTGNISNADLESLLASQLAAIANAFESHDYLELGRTSLIIHM
jgi:predicted nuclease of predicted toxin-antitoxin system